MPILIQCGSCQTRMNAPDNAGGKKVKCPKCATLVAVPGGPTPAPVAAAPSRKKPAQEDDFASALEKVAPKKSKRPVDDDEEEVRPVKKRSRREDDEEEERPAKRNPDDMLADLPEEEAELVEGELKGKERVLWVGKPLPKVYMWRAFPFLFGAIICIVMGIILFASFGKDKNTSAAVRILVPVGVIVVGLVFSLAPIFARKRAGRTFYALTNKRALVWNGGWLWGFSFEVYSAMQVSHAKRQNSWMVRGAGDLVFKEEVHITTTEHRDRRGRYQGSSQSVRIVQYGFIGIAEVGDVERLIRREITAKVERALDD